MRAGAVFCLNAVAAGGIQSGKIQFIHMIPGAFIHPLIKGSAFKNNLFLYSIHYFEIAGECSCCNFAGIWKIPKLVYINPHKKPPCVELYLSLIIQ